MGHLEDKQPVKRVAANSVIVLSFVVACEIAIMISPFAFFFYAVFNPFLLVLSHSPMTRWLTAFFLPHMIVPSDDILAVIRVLGSTCFMAGGVVFLVCAAQVYLEKLLKKGTASKGLCAVVRLHPPSLCPRGRGTCPSHGYVRDEARP